MALIEDHDVCAGDTVPSLQRLHWLERAPFGQDLVQDTLEVLPVQRREVDHRQIKIDHRRIAMREQERVRMLGVLLIAVHPGRVVPDLLGPVLSYWLLLRPSVRVRVKLPGSSCGQSGLHAAALRSIRYLDGAKAWVPSWDRTYPEEVFFSRFGGCRCGEIQHEQH